MTTINKVNIDYHFKRGYVINYTGDTHAYEVTWQKVYDDESGQPYTEGATVVADPDESYALEINLAAKTGYTFDSELTKVYFNGVPLAYTTNYYEDENQFKLHTEEYGMQLMVTFRYLAVEIEYHSPATNITFA